MHKIASLIAAAGLIATTSAAGAEDDTDLIPGDFSFNAALTTDYVFRGISQSKETPAIQGGIDYSVEATDYLGVYAGAWGSNVDFSDGNEAQVELDWYAGLTGAAMGVDWDLGAIYYTYPGASDALNYDYWEAALSLGYTVNDWLGVGAGVNYSPDYFGSSGDFVYPNANVTLTGPWKFTPTLSGAVGYNSIDDNTAWGTPDYWDWSIALGATVEGFDLSLAYIDTDLSEAECGSEHCEARAVFTVSKSF